MQDLQDEKLKELKCGEEVVLSFFRYFSILNGMLPISLIVSLEIIKVGQAYYMENDYELYTAHNKKRLKVLTSGVNEELG